MSEERYSFLKSQGPYKITTKQYSISCHRIFEREKIDSKTTKLMAHREEKEGQQFIFKEEYKGLYKIVFNTDDYGQKDWAISIGLNNEKPDLVLSKNDCCLWKLIKTQDDGFLIKSATNGYFFRLLCNSDERRDSFSYYVILTKNKKEATKFYFKSPLSPKSSFSDDDPLEGLF